MKWSIGNALRFEIIAHFQVQDGECLYRFIRIFPHATSDLGLHVLFDGLEFSVAAGMPSTLK